MRGAAGASPDDFVDPAEVAAANSTGGADAVQSSIDFTLGDKAENLLLTGAAAVNGTGNPLANTLTGNSGANNDVIPAGRPLDRSDWLGGPLRRWSSFGRSDFGRAFFPLCRVFRPFASRLFPSVVLLSTFGSPMRLLGPESV